MKNITSMNQNAIHAAGVFLATATYLSGCLELSIHESDPCEEMSAFSCDCMTDTDLPILALEHGLEKGCYHMLELFDACMARPGIAESVITREGEGPDQIKASDLCNGNGLEGMPGGCMSQGQYDDLILGMDNQKCYALDGANPLWDTLLTSFSSWKRYWMSQ